MFQLDARIRSIPAQRQQVLSLFESVNLPSVAIPGKAAGHARAYIVGLKGAAGVGVFVYLQLPDSNDCAVYLSERRTVTPEHYAAEEDAALAFVESMGFIVESLNFTSQPVERQDELLKTLPLFQRDPKLASAAKAGADGSGAQSLGRLLGSF